jgi:hypothetical protein
VASGHDTGCVLCVFGAFADHTFSLTESDHIAVILIVIHFFGLDMLVFRYIVRVVEHAAFARFFHWLLCLLLKLLIQLLIFYKVVVDFAVPHG